MQARRVKASAFIFCPAGFVRVPAFSMRSVFFITKSWIFSIGAVAILAVIAPIHLISLSQVIYSHVGSNDILVGRRIVRGSELITKI